MRILASVSVAVLVVFLARASAAPADASAALTGQMNKLTYLVGTWTCMTKVPAMNKMPAQTIAAKQRYWIEAGNVLGSYYSSKPYTSSGFLGWLDSKKLWWSDGADVFGAVAFETGKDSGTNVQTLTGTNWYQGKTATSRDTITKNSDSSFADVFEQLAGGKVIFQGSSICTKTSNASM